MRADVLIITVKDVEHLSVFRSFWEATGYGPKLVLLGDRTYYDFGTIKGARVFSVQSEMGAGGIGASQQTVQKGIAALSPSAVIMVGIAFGVDSKRQSLGDILVSQQLSLYEFQRVGTDKTGRPKLISRGDRPHASPWLLNRFQSANLCWDQSKAKLHFGLILSGEKLVDNVEFRQQLREIEPESIGGEMEGAGVYTACQDAKVDWILVKGISDWADGYKGGPNDQEYVDRFHAQDLAADNAARFVLHVLSQAPLRMEPRTTSKRLAPERVAEDDPIPPLSPPIIDRGDAGTCSTCGLEIKQILEGYSPHKHRRIFDVTIANMSTKQLLLTKFEITWSYRRGLLSVIERGMLLVPITTYVIELPIDTHDETQKSKTEAAYPSIVMPPANRGGPSLTTVRIHVQYFFSGGLDYHPQDDWNIFFDVSLVADTGVRLGIFPNYGWRVKEYERIRWSRDWRNRD